MMTPKPSTSEVGDPVAKPSAEDHLLETYVDVLIEHGPNSAPAQQFEREHADVPGAKELFASARDLDLASRRARAWRVATPAIWVACVAVAALIAVIGISRGWEVAHLSRETEELTSEVKRLAGWGWMKPDVLPQDGSAAAYFLRVADAAKDWFAQRPDTSAALARRIGEFRLGCTILIFDKHQPLSESQQKWLIGACHRWDEQAERHLAELEREPKDVKQVRTEMDKLVNNLLEDIRHEATKTASQ